MTNYVPSNSTIDITKPTHSEDAAFTGLVQIDLGSAAAAVAEVYKNFVVVKINEPLPADGGHAGRVPLAPASPLRRMFSDSGRMFGDRPR